MVGPFSRPQIVFHSELSSRRPRLSSVLLTLAMVAGGWGLGCSHGDFVSEVRLEEKIYLELDKGKGMGPRLV